MLQTGFDCSVVPGSFFEMPNHFRLGVGAESKSVGKALERLGRGLDHYFSKPSVPK